MNRWMESENAIVFNIMSGHNSCGTLETLAGKGGDELEKFLRGMVRPVLKQRADEAVLTESEYAQTRQRLDLALRALETMLAQPHIPLTEWHPDAKVIIKRAMPGHPQAVAL